MEAEGKLPARKSITPVSKKNYFVSPKDKALAPLKITRNPPVPAPTGRRLILKRENSLAGPRQKESAKTAKKTRRGGAFLKKFPGRSKNLPIPRDLK